MRTNEGTFEDKIRVFTGFTDTKFEMTHPTEMSTNMNFNKLTVICGMNGAGKSLVQKLMWASHTFLNMKLVEKVTGIKDTEKDDTTVLQYILDNTFDEQNFNGEFEWHMRDELLKVSFYVLQYKLTDGKVSDIHMSYPEDAQPGGGATFLSKDARCFGNIERYLKTKKMLNITELTGWKDLEALGDWFKLFDIFAIEQFLAKFDKAAPLIQMLKSFGGTDELLKIDLVDLKADSSTGKLYYINSKSEQKSLTTLGAGEQSIIMMLLSAV